MCLCFCTDLGNWGMLFSNNCLMGNTKLPQTNLSLGPISNYDLPYWANFPSLFTPAWELQVCSLKMTVLQAIPDCSKLWYLTVTTQLAKFPSVCLGPLIYIENLTLIYLISSPDHLKTLFKKKNKKIWLFFCLLRICLGIFL